MPCSLLPHDQNNVLYTSATGSFLTSVWQRLASLSVGVGELVWSSGSRCGNMNDHQMLRSSFDTKDGLRQHIYSLHFSCSTQLFFTDKKERILVKLKGFLTHGCTDFMEADGVVPLVHHGWLYSCWQNPKAIQLAMMGITSTPNTSLGSGSCICLPLLRLPVIKFINRVLLILFKQLK